MQQFACVNIFIPYNTRSILAARVPRGPCKLLIYRSDILQIKRKQSHPVQQPKGIRPRKHFTAVDDGSVNLLTSIHSQAFISYCCLHSFCVQQFITCIIKIPALKDWFLNIHCKLYLYLYEKQLREYKENSLYFSTQLRKRLYFSTQLRKLLYFSTQLRRHLYFSTQLRRHLYFSTQLSTCLCIKEQQNLKVDTNSVFTQNNYTKKTDTYL